MPMSATDSPAFIDTNVLVYLLGDDPHKADQAESVVRGGSIVSVQVLNEMTNIMHRKLAMSWSEIDEVIGIVQSLCKIEPLKLDTHNLGRFIARRYGFSVYDSMIVASALIAGCETLYTEDMQHNQVLERQLRICNPFAC